MIKDSSSAMGIARKLQAMHDDDMVSKLHEEALDKYIECASEHNDKNNASFFVLDRDKHIGVQIIPQWDYWVIEVIKGQEQALVIKR